jgi:2-amino-4-hydroxy-6-hydroxymethyldihydropteridine diphosphokinase
MVHDAVDDAAPDGGVAQIEIDATSFYYRLPVALPKSEVAVKKCKVARTLRNKQMILVAIGGNLPAAGGEQPLLVCRAAAESLRGLAHLRVVSVSRWYQSEPIPPADQPPYINGVVRLEGAAEPEWLLARLQRIEQAAGRTRSTQNDARTLDLDLIDLNGLVRGPAEADPVLPHPRAHLRAFVLLPLADVAPDWVHPVSRHTVARLIADLPPQLIAPM